MTEQGRKQIYFNMQYFISYSYRTGLRVTDMVTAGDSVLAGTGLVSLGLGNYINGKGMRRLLPLLSAYLIFADFLHYPIINS